MKDPRSLTEESLKKYLEDPLFNRTYNPDCTSCVTFVIHSTNHWDKYHPDAGTGHITDTQPIKTTKIKAK